MILYYDFYVGELKSHPNTWKYQDWKLAAKSPEQAVCFKMYLAQNHLKVSTNDILMLARMSVRIIVEFELVKREGKTKYRFKKKAEYRILEYLKVF